MDTFNWKQYVLNYSDLQNKGIKTYKSAWKHYIMYGKNENRSDKNILLNVPYIIKGYLDLLKEYQEHKNDIIPKIIFKTSPFTRTNMDNQIIHVLEITKQLNPDYTVYYFDDSEIEQFMKDNNYYNIYLKIKPSAFKTDFWRYCILQKYGGCYSDIGHTMKVSFDEIIDNNNLVLVKDLENIGIHNSLICCKKNNLLMEKAIERCIHNINNKYYGVNAFDITGPHMLYKLFKEIYQDTISLNNYYLTTNKTIMYKNKVILDTKFDNYYFIMYKKLKDHYIFMWNNRTVYS